MCVVSRSIERFGLYTIEYMILQNRLRKFNKIKLYVLYVRFTLTRVHTGVLQVLYKRDELRKNRYKIWLGDIYAFCTNGTIYLDDNFN